MAAQRAVDIRVDSAPPRIPLHIAGVPPVPAGASASAAHHLEVAGIAVRTPAMVVRPKTGVTAVAHLTDGVAAVTRVGVVAPRPSVTAMGWPGVVVMGVVTPGGRGVRPHPQLRSSRGGRPPADNHAALGPLTRIGHPQSAAWEVPGWAKVGRGAHCSRAGRGAPRGVGG